MVFKKIIFQSKYVELATPPPFKEKNILNFHFDYWNPSLLCIEGPPLFCTTSDDKHQSKFAHFFSILREFISTLDIISPLQLLSILIFKCNFNLQGSYQIIMIIFK